MTSSSLGFTEPVVSFVIPVRNDPARLARCLDAIQRNELPEGEVEIIVCDNGSTDQTPEVARDAGARVLDLPGIKISALRNRGAREARAQVLAFCDSDNLIVEGWLQAVLETLEQHPEAGAIGAACEAPADGNWVQKTYDALRAHPPGVRTARWLHGGNLACRRAAFLAVDGFDERLETCEDVDLCNRLRESGRALLSDSRLRSIHLGDPDSLRKIFRAELWRGRDNLRVSFRGDWKLRDLPSAIIPILDLCFLGIAAAGLLTTAMGGWRASLAALAGFGTLSILRAGKMLRQSETMGIADAHKVLAVALVYDLARALALVYRAGHHRKHEGTPANAQEA